MNPVAFELMSMGCELYLSVFTGQVIGSFLNRKISLKRINKYEDCLIVKKEDLNNIQEFESDKIYENKVVKKHLSILTDYISEEDLNLVTERTKTLKIKRSLFFCSTASGTYESQKNKIKYSTKSSLGHEFLHAISSRYDKSKKIILTGFAQTKGLAFIGKGLNEGFTEYLNSCIFQKDKKKYNPSYESLASICELLKIFYFDEDGVDMLKLYINNDLPSFIEHMSKYMGKERATSFVLDMDKILAIYEIPFNIKHLYASLKLKIELYEIYKNKHQDNKEAIRYFESCLRKDPLIKISTLKSELKEKAKELVKVKRPTYEQ